MYYTSDDVLRIILKHQNILYTNNCDSYQSKYNQVWFSINFDITHIRVYSHFRTENNHIQVTSFNALRTTHICTGMVESNTKTAFGNLYRMWCKHPWTQNLQHLQKTNRVHKSQSFSREKLRKCEGTFISCEMRPIYCIQYICNIWRLQPAQNIT